MITIRKLSSLARKTALRKSAALFQGFERDLRAGRSVDIGYIRDVLSLIESGNEDGLALPARDMLSVVQKLDEPHIGGSRAGDPPTGELLRLCNNARHLLLRYLGTEPADWDLMESADSVEPTQRRTFPMRVFLEDIRSPFNVGAVFRTGESFGVESFMLTAACPSPDHPRAKRSSMGCTEIVPWRIGSLDEIEENEAVFALELGGTPIEAFSFPTRGTVIIGSEELGASPEARSRASKSAGRVSIPLYGLKGSLNVSAAFAILIHAWHNRLR